MLKLAISHLRTEETQAIAAEKGDQGQEEGNGPDRVTEDAPSEVKCICKIQSRSEVSDARLLWRDFFWNFARSLQTH